MTRSEGLSQDGHRVPVTVLTGYLGAGKSTLLKRLLVGTHGRKYAVVVNEFGRLGIDRELITQSGDARFEMSNGSICWAVRRDLRGALTSLLPCLAGMDALVIETTGLAAPAPVAQLLITDRVLRKHFALDSITTVVDARHFPMRMAYSREATEQVALADQIVLNKIDLIDEPQLTSVERTLRLLNPHAPIQRALRGDIPADLLRTRSSLAYGGSQAAEPGFLDSRHAGTEDGGLVSPDADGTLGVANDHGIKAVELVTDRPLNEGRAQRWLESLVAGHGTDILRGKGVLHCGGAVRRLAFQSVHSLLEFDWQRSWHQDEPRTSRLVFIGRRIDQLALERALRRCELP